MATTTHSATLIETTDVGVRVVMPTPRIGCIAVFLGAWLLGWAAGEISALKALFRALGGGTTATLDGALALGGAAFMLVWLIGWTVGGVFAGFMFLMVLDGREIVTVGDGILRRRVETFKWGFSWRYPLDRVSNLRPTDGSDGVKSFISFDFSTAKGEKTIRFGTGLSETSAEEAAEQIWAAFPDLMPSLERRQRERAAETATGPGASAADGDGASDGNGDLGPGTSAILTP